MKRYKFIIIISFGLFILGIIAQDAHAQAVLSTTDDPVTADPSAMLQIISSDRGLLIPSVSMVVNDGKPAPSNITVTPADGLLVYNHNGSNEDVSRGFWYYDAELNSGEWVFYSDLTTVEATTSLDDFAEMFEVQDYGNGTQYLLSQDYFIPWRSGTPGLKGAAFEFLDDEEVILTPTVSDTADQIKINTVGEAVYSVIISATIASTAPSNTVTGQLFVNDVAVDNIFFRNTFQLKDKPTSLNTSGNIQLGPDDRVDFRFKSKDKNKGIKVEYVNIRLVNLGEI